MKVEILIDFANQEQVLLYDGSDQVTKEEAFLLYDVITQRRQELRAKIERNQNKREERRRLERRLKHRKKFKCYKKTTNQKKGRSTSYESRWYVNDPSFTKLFKKFQY